MANKTNSNKNVCEINILNGKVLQGVLIRQVLVVWILHIILQESCRERKGREVAYTAFGAIAIGSSNMFNHLNF